VGWEHSSPRRFNSFPGYLPGDNINRVDARAGVEMAGISLAVFADNLTNDNGATSFRSVQPLGPGDLDITSPRLRPRTFGIELSATFGGPAR
ncbi:MAG TPA: TonB-dependent receptor, partial [Novosphingobium sp.]|nr:TonB-dependent receptor [Novosphingobium sp.]